MTPTMRESIGSNVLDENCIAPTISDMNIWKTPQRMMKGYRMESPLFSPMNESPGSWYASITDKQPSPFPTPTWSEGTPIRQVKRSSSFSTSSDPTGASDRPRRRAICFGSPLVAWGGNASSGEERKTAAQPSAERSTCPTNIPPRLAVDTRSLRWCSDGIERSEARRLADIGALVELYVLIGQREAEHRSVVCSEEAFLRSQLNLRCRYGAQQSADISTAPRQEGHVCPPDRNCSLSDEYHHFPDRNLPLSKYIDACVQHYLEEADRVLCMVRLAHAPTESSSCGTPRLSCTASLFVSTPVRGATTAPSIHGDPVATRWCMESEGGVEVNGDPLDLVGCDDDDDEGDHQSTIEIEYTGRERQFLQGECSSSLVIGAEANIELEYPPRCSPTFSNADRRRPEFWESLSNDLSPPLS